MRKARAIERSFVKNKETGMVGCAMDELVESRAGDLNAVSQIKMAQGKSVEGATNNKFENKRENHACLCAHSSLGNY